MPDYTVHRHRVNKQNNYLVTVITPVYNAESFLEKSIDSVLNQTLGKNHIEYILIDDCSTDGSREILLNQWKKYEYMTVALLDCNSGSPGLPRNVGMRLATAPYVTFLDADDWLDPDGLQVLYHILEKTGDPYVVGRTIKVEDGRTSIIGEHQCSKERRSVPPLSIPHIFNHLGPPSKMMRTSFIREQQVSFPEMKFAEGKQFFMDVLVKCKTISTTISPICYVNRLSKTKTTRLTNQTNILEKTKYNLHVVEYILRQKYNIEIEKEMLTRIYEFDLLRGLLTTPHFQKTKLKLLYYYKIRRIIMKTKQLSYDVSEGFFHPIHKIIFDLILTKKYRSVTKLLEWERTVKVKDIKIIHNKPYIVAPFLPKDYQHIPILIFINWYKHDLQENRMYLYFHAYGDFKHSIVDVLLRDLTNLHHDHTLQVKMKENGEGVVDFDFDMLNRLPAANYSIFIRYNDYMRTNIRLQKTFELKKRYKGREFIFFRTPYSNIALKVF